MAIQTKQVEVQYLLFDANNPRLPEDVQHDQRRIFRYLVDDIGVEDLVNSMATSGVIDGDPVIARPAEKDGYFYVIEGNRRLAALKLLNGQKIGDGGTEPTVPDVGPEVADTLKKIRLELGWADDKLEAYLGYKHVTAAREWTPEAKAKFVLTRCGRDFSEENLSKFSRRVGTTPPTLRRWLVAYLTLRQAEVEQKFNPAEAYRKRYFGTFYTLLGSQNVQDFLGLKPGPLTETPIPKDHLGELGEFIGWVIGTKSSPPLLNSRSQQEFDAVLASPSGLQYFRSKRNLEGALLYTEFNSDQIAEKLLNAAYTIEECLPKIFDVKDDSKVISAIENLDRAFQKLRINTANAAPVAKRRRH
jgi:hypothetical protein